MNSSKSNSTRSQRASGKRVFACHLAFAVQHAVMVPAMLGVMLWHYSEYASPHTPMVPVAADPGGFQGRSG